MNRHNCQPPCSLMRIEEARAKRPRMTKAQLIEALAQNDEAWINQAEELDMANAYIDDLTDAGRIALTLHVAGVGCNPLVPMDGLIARPEHHMRLHRDDATKISAASSKVETT